MRSPLEPGDDAPGADAVRAGAVAPGGTDGGGRAGGRLAEVGAVLLAVASAAVHLVAGFFYLTSGLLAPLWAVAGLLVVWAALGAWLVVLARRRSWWTPVVPLVAVVTWFAVLSVGEQALGWTP
ncbi:hypothetical protein [Thalassiella azotivora]